MAVALLGVADAAGIIAEAVQFDPAEIIAHIVEGFGQVGFGLAAVDARQGVARQVGPLGGGVGLKRAVRPGDLYLPGAAGGVILAAVAQAQVAAAVFAPLEAHFARGGQQRAFAAKIL